MVAKPQLQFLFFFSLLISVVQFITMVFDSVLPQVNLVTSSSLFLSSIIIPYISIGVQVCNLVYNQLDLHIDTAEQLPQMLNLQLFFFLNSYSQCVCVFGLQNNFFVIKQRISNMVSNKLVASKFYQFVIFFLNSLIPKH